MQKFEGYEENPESFGNIGTLGESELGGGSTPSFLFSSSDVEFFKTNLFEPMNFTLLEYYIPKALIFISINPYFGVFQGI